VGTGFRKYAPVFDRKTQCELVGKLCFWRKIEIGR